MRGNATGSPAPGPLSAQGMSRESVVKQHRGADVSLPGELGFGQQGCAGAEDCVTIAAHRPGTVNSRSVARITEHWNVGLDFITPRSEQCTLETSYELLKANNLSEQVRRSPRIHCAGCPPGWGRSPFAARRWFSLTGRRCVSYRGSGGAFVMRRRNRVASL